MSAPVSDDESPEYQKYAPKRLREQQPQLHPSSQSGVASPPMSPSHAQIQGRRTETSGLPSSGGDLENEVPRRLYEPEPLSQPSAPVSDDESSRVSKVCPKAVTGAAATAPPVLTVPRRFAAHVSLARTNARRRTETSGLPFLRRRFGRQVVPTTVRARTCIPAAGPATPRILCAAVDQLACDRSGVHRADRDDCHNHETTLAWVRYTAPTASVQTI